MHLAIQFNRQIQMHTHTRTFDQVYLRVIAHCAAEWNSVPCALYTITYEPSWQVADAIEIISLITHGADSIHHVPVWTLHTLGGVWSPQE